MPTVVRVTAYIQTAGNPGATGVYADGVGFRMETTLLITVDSDASQVQQDALTSSYQLQFPDAVWFEIMFLS